MSRTPEVRDEIELDRLGQRRKQHVEQRDVFDQVVDLFEVEPPALHARVVHRSELIAEHLRHFVHRGDDVLNIPDAAVDVEG